jgi:hypothetical protein
MYGHFISGHRHIVIIKYIRTNNQGFEFIFVHDPVTYKRYLKSFNENEQYKDYNFSCPYGTYTPIGHIRQCEKHP